MAPVHLVQGVTIYISGLLFPQTKYAGTSKKVDAGMGNAAGKASKFVG